MRFTFRKEEHLCSRQLIDRLYTEGDRLMAFPYSVQWMVLPDVDTALRPSHFTAHGTPCQVMIVAPKRKFKHAVDRNRVRRLTRECYRTRKHELYAFLQQHGLKVVFSMVYVHNEIMTFEHLGRKMDKLLAALMKDIEAKQTSAT